MSGPGEVCQGTGLLVEVGRRGQRKLLFYSDEAWDGGLVCSDPSLRECHAVHFRAGGCAEGARRGSCASGDRNVEVRPCVGGGERGEFVDPPQRASGVGQTVCGGREGSSCWHGGGAAIRLATRRVVYVVDVRVV